AVLPSGACRFAGTSGGVTWSSAAAGPATASAAASASAVVVFITASCLRNRNREGKDDKGKFAPGTPRARRTDTTFFSGKFAHSRPEALPLLCARFQLCRWPCRFVQHADGGCRLRLPTDRAITPGRCTCLAFEDSAARSRSSWRRRRRYLPSS